MTQQQKQSRSLSEFVYKGLRKRIILATALISAVLAVIVYLDNYRLIDDYVESVALDRTERFNLIFIDLLDDPDNLDSKAIHDALIRFTNTRKQDEVGEFIHIRILDRQANTVTHLSFADAEELSYIKEISDANQKNLPSIDTTYSDDFKINNHYHIYLQVPLRGSDGKVTAIVETVFSLSDEAIYAIWEDTFITIFYVISIVIITSLILYPVITRLTKQLAVYSEDLLESNLETIQVLGSAIAKRDSDTDAHNYRVSIYAIQLAKQIGLNDLSMQSLIKGSFLHDVGKIGIRDNILLKPGRLDKDEFGIMKTHVNHGNEIIAGARWLSDASGVVFSHHEKFDGSGYPEGLKGHEIPIEARIFAIVDVFDALTSKRPYKEPFSYEKTVAILEESKGSHFDPEVLDAFLKISNSLYNKYSGREDDNLKQELADLITEYFSSGLDTLRY